MPEAGASSALAGVLHSDTDAQSSGSSTPPILANGHRKTGSLNADEIEQLKGKTSFRLAHPPPLNQHKQRLRIRPRVLLQLHQISDRSRANLDVLPSMIFAPRLSSRFPKLFRGKAGLGPHDLVVMGNSAYGNRLHGRAEDDDSANEENWDDNEVVATICQTRRPSSDTKTSTEICFTNGKSWQASQLPNGSYEFTSRNSDGSVATARWVLRKKAHQRASTSHDALEQAHSRKDRRFNFSLIDPEKRKHPVIASMTRDAININNHFQPLVDDVSSPSSEGFGSGRSPPPEADSNNYFDNFNTLGNKAQKGPSVETDESLRSLIVLTGIWIVFKEGWSRNFSYDETSSNNTSNDTAVSRNGSKRNVSQPSTADKALNCVDGHGRRSTSQPLKKSSFSTRRSSKRSPTRVDPTRTSSSRNGARDDTLKHTGLSEAANGQNRDQAEVEPFDDQRGPLNTSNRSKKTESHVVGAGEHYPGEKGNMFNCGSRKTGQRNGSSSSSLKRRMQSLLGKLSHREKA
ncbi:MAG: hypothetical protein Q9227_008444 [Pyrenula ochraceoflavens]